MNNELRNKAMEALSQLLNPHPNIQAVNIAVYISSLEEEIGTVQKPIKEQKIGIVFANKIQRREWRDRILSRMSVTHPDCCRYTEISERIELIISFNNKTTTFILFDSPSVQGQRFDRLIITPAIQYYEQQSRQLHIDKCMRERKE